MRNLIIPTKSRCERETEGFYILSKKNSLIIHSNRGNRQIIADSISKTWWCENNSLGFGRIEFEKILRGPGYYTTNIVINQSDGTTKLSEWCMKVYL